ncbi:MAG: hypothetical protein TREMPRED_003512 [Tremellales sp. Tagirdzhanova-0007]|nr:MAG: hypothetical protein TREMPRED_003512 [Tremellales sp. Tagirdzhanova-0007]
MLHRRTTTHTDLSNSIPSQHPSTVSGPSSTPPPPVRNKAYTPLRRQSSNLYPTPPSGPKARYNLPPVSPSHLGGMGSSPALPHPGAGGYTVGAGLGFGKSGFEADGMENGRGKGEKILERIGQELEFGVGGCLYSPSDVELWNLVIKSTLINLLSLLLLSLSPRIFSPLLPTSSRTNQIGLWYELLFSGPVFVVCFGINASWAPDISRRAQMLLHPAYRHQPTLSTSSTLGVFSDPSAWVFNTLTRILLISDFTLVTRSLAIIPLIGRPAALTYMCIINSFYCFETTFNAKQWPLDHRITFMQERTAYMIGFGKSTFPIVLFMASMLRQQPSGLVATALTSFGPTLVNMALFALIYPFYVIQAMQSRPPTPQTSLLPSTPSPRSSVPSSPSEGGPSLHNPFFASTGSVGPREWKLEPKLPIFFFARFALEGLAWLEHAVGRERGSS